MNKKPKSSMSKSDFDQIFNECFTAVLFKLGLRKTLIWFATPNPILGEVEPYKMLNKNRIGKLLDAINSMTRGDLP